MSKYCVCNNVRLVSGKRDLEKNSTQASKPIIETQCHETVTGRFVPSSVYGRFAPLLVRPLDVSPSRRVAL